MTRSILCACFSIALAAGAALAGYGEIPLNFAENEGQAPREVRFLSRGPGYRVLLSAASAEIGARGDAIRMTLLGASPSPRIEGAQPLWPVHYLVGRDPSRWHTNVPTYGRVLYRSVYPGVDLVFYGNERRLEYDFTVAAGADPRAIRLEIGGPQRIAVDPDGSLVLGPFQFHKPVAYQMLDGARHEVSCAYRVHGRQVGFRTGAYDRTHALVIDPVFVYSTHLGGSGSDSARTIAVDRDGNAYVAGTTNSADFPVTPGAAQPRLVPRDCGVASPLACSDIFVAKLNPAGTALVYATYLGGTYDDFPEQIAVDAQGNAYLLVATLSYDFPVVNPLFQPSAQPNADGYWYYLVKLSPDGSRLLFSTPLPQGNFWVSGLALDPDGNAWLTGSASAGWPSVKALQEYVPPANIFKSSDSGANWQSAGAVPATLPDLVAIAVDPQSNLYAVTYNWNRYGFTGSSSVFYRSTDGGRTWTASAAALPGASPFAGYPAALALDPVRPSTIYLGTRDGVFKSTDSGQTWVQQAGQTMPVTSIAIDPRNPSTLFVGSSGPVYKSTDGGVDWTALGVSATVVAVDPKTAGIVYAASGSSVYKSTDSGATWTPSGTGITSNAVIRALAIDPVTTNILYAAGTGRPNLVHKSTDGGATWQPAVGGLLLGEVNALVLNPLLPSQLFTAAVDGISVSNDGAQTWAPVARQLPSQSPCLAIHPASGALYAPLKSTGFGSATPSAPFVTKIDASGSSVLFSTLLGGSSADLGQAIAVDRSGRVYIAGSATSPDFPLVNPLQPKKVGQTVGFLTVLAGDGSAVLSSSYLDGEVWALGLDGGNRAYLLGAVPSLSGYPDGWVISGVNPFAPALLYSKVQSGYVLNLAADSGGNVYFPGTCVGGPYDPNNPPGQITQLDPTGAVGFSLCFSGASPASLAVDDSGGLYVAGGTSSPNFPTLNPLQPVLKGQENAFVAKLDLNTQLPAPALQAVAGAASYQPQAVATGGLVALFGAGLASGVSGAGAVPLPTTLLDAVVSFNGVPAPLLYVSPNQINAQVPFEVAPGPVTVTVARESQSASLTVTVAEAGPGIFTRNAQGSGPGAILHAADLSPVSDASPAHPGEALAIYCTGLGLLSPPVTTGSAPPAPPPDTVLRPQVRVAGQSAAVTYSGAAPQFVGLYQVNIEVPPGTPSGSQPLVLSIGGVDSNTVQVAVQ